VPRRAASAALLSAALLPLLSACGSSITSGDRAGQAGWGRPEVLAEAAVFDGSQLMSLSGDGAGQAVAVWAPSTIPYPPVLARRFSPQEGWLSVETIRAGGSGSVATPAVRMNARGDMVAIWDTYDGLRASVHAAGGTWGPAEIVRRGSGTLWNWGLDDAGNAIVAWTAGGRIFTSRFEAGRGWQGLGALPGAEPVDPFGVPAVAVSGSGLAVAGWSTQTGEVWASSFDPGRGWSLPSRLSQEPSRVLLVSAFANARGDGLVTWYGSDPSAEGSGALFASFYENATDFLPGEVLGPTVGTAMAAAIDLNGTSIVVYMSGLGLRVQRHAAGGWQAPEALDGVGGFDSVTLDDHGSGWVLWSEPSAENREMVSLRSRRLAAGRAIGMAEEISPPALGLAWFSGTRMDAPGGLSAAWFRLTSEPGEPGRFALMAARYHPGETAGRTTN